MKVDLGRTLRSRGDLRLELWTLFRRGIHSCSESSDQTLCLTGRAGLDQSWLSWRRKNAPSARVANGKRNACPTIINSSEDNHPSASSSLCVSSGFCFLNEHSLDILSCNF